MKIKMTLSLWLFATLAIIFSVGYLAIDASGREIKETIGESSASLAESVTNEIDMGVFNSVDVWKEHTRDTVLQSSLASSNREFESMADAESYIMEMDAEWVSTPKNETTVFMKVILDNALSNELRKKASFYSMEHGYSVYGEVFVTNRYGANVAQTGKTSDYRQDDEKWWQDAARDGLFVGDVEYDESAGVYSLVIGIRIEDDDGEFAGVMKVVNNIDHTISHVREINTIERFKSAAIELIDNKGRVVYSSNNEFGFLQDVSNEDFYGKIRGNKGYFEETEPNGEEMLFSYAKSKGHDGTPILGWTLIVEYSHKDAFRTVDGLQNTFFIASFISVALIMSVGYALNRRFLVSLERLTKVIDDISIGNFSSSIDEKIKAGDDEIAGLARSFERTIVSLKLAIRQTAPELRKDLIANEARYKALVDSVLDAIVTANEKGDIIQFNREAERTFGYTAEETIGRPLTILMPEKYVEGHRKGFERYVATWEPHVIGKTVRLEGKRKNGEEFPMELSLSSWSTVEGRFFTGIIREIRKEQG